MTTQTTGTGLRATSLYVGNLHPNVSEPNLFEVFNAVGRVASIRLFRDTTETSFNFAFVKFHSVDDAERALEILNFTSIKGRQCRMMPLQRDKSLPEHDIGTVFVENLHEKIDSKTLYETFSVFGDILSCKVATDRETGKSRCYGYINYLRVVDANKAIEGVNNMVIGDKQLHVKLVSGQERIEKASWNSVYMKHIPAKMTQEEIKKFVEEKTGSKVICLRCWDKPMLGKRACFIFDAHEDAQKCVDVLNKYEMKEFADEKEENKTPKLYVSLIIKRSERDGDLKMAAQNTRMPPAPAANNLYVKPLGPGVTDEKLRELFVSHGTIVSAKVMKNPETGESRGFGFVCFTQSEAASQALVKLNGSMFEGVKLYVARAQKKAERQQFLANRARIANYRRINDNTVMQPYFAGPSQMGSVGVGKIGRAHV